MKDLIPIVRDSQVPVTHRMVLISDLEDFFRQQRRLALDEKLNTFRLQKNEGRSLKLKQLENERFEFKKKIADHQLRLEAIKNKNVFSTIVKKQEKVKIRERLRIIQTNTAREKANYGNNFSEYLM